MATNPPQNPVFPRKENPASLPIRFQGLAHGRADARKSAEIYPLKTEGGGGHVLAGWLAARPRIRVWIDRSCFGGAGDGRCMSCHVMSASWGERFLGEGKCSGMFPVRGDCSTKILVREQG